MTIPTKPLSRSEQYLNVIATGDGELPTKPLSRSEQYLDYICRNGCYGSGDDNLTDRVLDIEEMKDIKNTTHQTSNGYLSLPKTISGNISNFKLQGLTVKIEKDYSYKVERIGEWITGLSPLPTKRSYASGAILDSKIYVMGGAGASNTNECYDTTTNTWDRKQANIPFPANSCAATSCGDKIYLLGGDGSYTDKLYSYQPSTDNWTELANLISPRTSARAVNIDNFIYVIGGYKSGFKNTADRYNITTNSWETIANMPTARAELSCAVVDGKIYAIGGSANGNRYATNECYDPATNQWTTKKPMPTALFGLLCITVGKKIYCLGGYDSTHNYCYDTENDSWTSETTMPSGRYIFQGAEVDGKIYCIGGNGINSVDAYVASEPIPPEPQYELISVGNGSHIEVLSRNNDASKEHNKSILFKNDLSEFTPITDLHGKWVDGNFIWGDEVFKDSNGNYIYKKGADIRPYQSEDENNENCITDMTNTVYRLDQDIIYECNNIDLEAYEYGTDFECLSGPIHPHIEFELTKHICSFLKIMSDRVKDLENKISKYISNTNKTDINSMKL